MEEINDNDIVISGIAGRFPESGNIHELWKHLINGDHLVRFCDRRWPSGLYSGPLYMGMIPHINQVDYEFFGIDKRTADLLDPQIRFGFETITEAIMDAGLTLDQVRNTKTGFFYGACMYDRQMVECTHVTLEPCHQVCTILPLTLGLDGPVSHQDTGCASGLTALTQVFHSIRSGECDQAIIYAANVTTNPLRSATFHGFGATTMRNACRPLDSQADGFVRGEAAGAIFVQLRHRAKRQYMTVESARANYDGYKHGVTYPLTAGQQRVYMETFNNSKFKPHDMDFIEGHMTGTRAGDKVECETFMATIRKDCDRTLLVGGVKSNTGHAEGAAGIISLVKVALSFSNRTIPGNLFYCDPNMTCPGLMEGIIKPCIGPTPFNKNLACIASYGIYGTNAFGIFTQKNRKEFGDEVPKGMPVVVPVVSRTSEGIKRSVEYLRDNHGKITVDFIALCEDAFGRTPIESGWTNRAFITMANDGQVEVLSKELPKQRLVWMIFSSRLTIDDKTKSVLLQMPAIQKLVKFKDISSDLSFNGEVNSLFTDYAIFDVLRSMGVRFDKICGDAEGAQTAAYATNNIALTKLVKLNGMTETVLKDFLSPKSLAEAPEGAIVIEVGGSKLLDTAGKRKDLIRLPITSQDVVGDLFRALGQLFINGHPLKLTGNVYPVIKWPVANRTIPVSPMIHWDHQRSIRTFQYPDYFRGTNIMTHPVDITSPQDAYLKDHALDGRVLLPGVGFLWLAWKTVAERAGYEDPLATCVEFWGVTLHQAVVLSDAAAAEVKVTVNDATHQFHVIENGVLCVAGHCRIRSRLDLGQEYGLVRDFKVPDPIMVVPGKDCYVEARIRGYDYGPKFQGLVEACIDLGISKVKWTGEWISFTDAVLHLLLISSDDRSLRLPTYVARFQCDGQVMQRIQDNKETVTVNFNAATSVTRLEGMVFQGIKLSSTTMRCNFIQGQYEEYHFIPFNEQIDMSKFDHPVAQQRYHEYRQQCEALVRGHSIVGKQLSGKVLDVLSKIAFKDMKPDVVQELLKTEKDLLTDPLFGHPYLVERFIRPAVDVIVVNLNQPLVRIGVYGGTTNPLTIWIQNRKAINAVTPDFIFLNRDGLPRSNDFRLSLAIDKSVCSMSPVTVDGFEVLKNFAEYGAENSMLLLADWIGLAREPLELMLFPCPSKITDTFIVDLGLLIMVRKVTETGHRLLVIRKPMSSKPLMKCFKIDTGLKWFNKIKKEMKNEIIDRIWMTWDPTREADMDFSGLIGAIGSMVDEPGGEKLRCLFGAEKPTDELIRLDFVMNILRDGEWGSYQHITLKSKTKTEPIDYWKVESKAAGSLEDALVFEETPSKFFDSLADHKIRVAFVGLSGRDVQLATNKITPSSFENGFKRIGLELSGLDQRSGQRVMCFHTVDTIAPAIAVNDWTMSWPVPPNWSLEQAATIPVAYMTAYYSLVLRGQIQKGETVLIHCGAGGVGQAATRVALARGCRVMVTCGGEDKKRFLLNTYPAIDPADIGSSRDESFEELVLRRTDGRGVDLVLNCLEGDLIDASIRCLADQGRFIHFEKASVLSDRLLSMTAFERKQLHVICIFNLVALGQQSKRVRVMMDQAHQLITEGIRFGEVQPIVSTVLDSSKVVDAFKLMKGGQHIGKVILKVNDQLDRLPLAPQVTKLTLFNPKKCYIVTGGLGGMGLQQLAWMASLGAKQVVVTTRSGIKQPYQKYMIDHLQRVGLDVHVVRNSLASEEDAHKLMVFAYSLAPVDGIFHLSMVLNDKKLDDLTLDDFKRVCDSKIRPLHHLDRVTRSAGPNSIRYFVVYSSAASGLGFMGQAAYSYANSAMENLVEQRRVDGHVGVVVQWGAIGDIGALAELMGQGEYLYRNMLSMRISSCMLMLGQIIQLDRPIVMAVIVQQRNYQGTMKSAGGLIGQVVAILGIDANEPTLDKSQNMVKAGIDSLMATEVVNLLIQKYKVVLTSQQVRTLTFDDLKQFEMTGDKAALIKE